MKITCSLMAIWALAGSAEALEHVTLTGITRTKAVAAGSLVVTFSHGSGLFGFLLFGRAVQGFGAGAEQASGIVLLTETAPKGQRGRYASLVFVGAAAGAAMAAVVWILVQRMSDEALLSYGWRLVFFSSIFVTIAAWIIRRKVKESPVFEELKDEGAIEKEKSPVADVWKHGKKHLARIFFMNVGANAHSYIFQVFAGAYLINEIDVDPKWIPKFLLAGAVFGSRLLLGTGGVPSLDVLERAITASGTEIVTVALRRVDPLASGSLLDVVEAAGVRLLPNTAGFAAVCVVATVGLGTMAAVFLNILKPTWRTICSTCACFCCACFCGALSPKPVVALTGSPGQPPGKSNRAAPSLRVFGLVI